MQSASVTFIQSAPPKAKYPAAQAAGGSTEQVPETPSSGQGIRNSPACQSSANDTQFAAFLQNGTVLNAFSPEGLLDLQLTVSEEENKKTGQEGLLDISSLLMQLTMSSAPMQVQNVADGDLTEAGNTALSSLSGVLDASPEAIEGVIMAKETPLSAGLQQNGEPAEAVLSRLADSIAAMKNEQPADAADGQTGTEPAEISAAYDKTLSHVLTDAPESTDSKTPVSAVIQDGSGNVAASDLAAGKRIAGAVPAGDGSQSDSRFGAFSPQNKKEDSDTGTAVNVLQQAVADIKFNGEAEEKTAAVEKALNRLTDDLRSIKSGRQEIKIVLEPESLGVLTISVLKTENGISAKIRSEDKEVAAAITDQLQKLISSMQNKGINIKEVDVAYSQTEQNMSFLSHGFSQSREETSSGYNMPRNRSAESETPDTDPWQGYYGGTTGDTTVDYRI